MGWKLSVGVCPAVVVRAGFRFGGRGGEQRRGRRQTQGKKREERERERGGAGEKEMARSRSEERGERNGVRETHRGGEMHRNGNGREKRKKDRWRET